MKRNPEKMRADRWGRRALFILLCWIFLAQLAWGARQLSLTIDEPSHLMNGYAVWTTGSYWTVPPHTHPPLANLLSAAPLLLEPDRPDPRQIAGWQRDFVRFMFNVMPQWPNLERLELVGRYPIMLLALILMALVYRWTKERAGGWGALLAMGVMIWDPTLVAHSQLMTNDLVMTLLGFAFFYRIERLSRRRTLGNWVWAGVLLGAALATKTSAMLLVPVGLGLLSLTVWLAHPRPSRAWWPWIGGMLFLLAVAGVTLWAVYGFEWSGGPLPSHMKMLQIFSSDRTWGAFAGGQRQRGGWWWYFPLVIAIKTPLPVLIAFLILLGIVLRQGGARLWADRWLWVFPLFYLATAMWSGVNVGYRHLLPIFPFVYVGLGELVPALAAVRSKKLLLGLRSAGVLLGFWLILGTLRIYPFSVAYFNETIGGARQGYRYLVDSNLDWGQYFKALRIWMQTAGVQQVELSYFSWVDPARYGIRYHKLPPARRGGDVLLRQYDPAPGVYAIGATPLQGLLLRDPDLYEWFRHCEPVAEPGYGLLIYDVRPHNPPATWLAQCHVPVIPLTSEKVKVGLGRADLRQIRFDCTQGWIYPRGGLDTGWYGIYRSTWQNGGAWMRRQLTPARLSYEQVETGEAPPFVLWEQEGGQVITSTYSLEGVAAFDAGEPGALLAQTPAVQAPLATDGPLTLLGYSLVPKGETGPELWTYWRVESVPDRALSLMAHLVGANNQPIAVGDGLAVPRDQWQAGDVLVQRHRFEIPAGTARGVYWFQIGAYWSDPLARWSFVKEGRPIGNRLIVGLWELK